MRPIAVFPSPISLADIRTRLAPPKGAAVVRPDVVYDTQTYPLAGLAAGARLSFFSDPTHLNDPTRSNMDGFINQFQPGHTFHVVAISLDFMSETSHAGAAAATGIANDIAQITKASRGWIEFTDKSRRQSRAALPLHMIGGSGGVETAIAGNDGAAGYVQVARNAGAPTPYDALLAEQSAFQFDLVAGAVAAVSAALDVRLGLWGWHYQET